MVWFEAGIAGPSGPQETRFYQQPGYIFAIACQQAQYAVSSQKVFQNGVEITANLGKAGRAGISSCTQQILFEGSAPNSAITRYPSNVPPLVPGQNTWREDACSGSTTLTRRCTSISQIYWLSNVRVTPNFIAEPWLQPNGPNYVTTRPNVATTQPFKIENTGTASATFGLVATCAGAGVGKPVEGACGGVPTSVTIAAGQQTTVNVPYTAGDSNTTGTIRLIAKYGSTVVADTSVVNVTSNWVSYLTADVHGATVEAQPAGACANACFAATAAISTVPYFSGDAGRAVGLSYNSDRRSPRPFIHVDVSMAYGHYPVQEYWLEVKKANGTSIRFLNGEARLRFDGSAVSYGPRYRLAAQLDAHDNSMDSTWAYPVNVTVTVIYQNGHQEKSSVSKKLLVVNSADSPVAAGWEISGLQRLYAQAGDWAMIVDGDGSAHLFTQSGTAFSPPTGEYSALTQVSGGYVRSYADSSVVTFDNTGRMTSVSDAFGNTVLYTYDSRARLIRVSDPVRKDATGAAAFTSLQYATGVEGIERIVEPGPDGSGGTGRVTSFLLNPDRTLQRVTDPDGRWTSFGYDAAARLETVINRNGAVTKYVYDPLSWKLARVELPAIDTSFNAGRFAIPTVNYLPWQVVGVPSGQTLLQGTGAPLAQSDTIAAYVTDAGGHYSRMTVNRWGQPRVTRDPLGNETRIFYNIGGTGPLTDSIITPRGTRIALTYEGPRVKTRMVIAQSMTSFTYDGGGRLTSVSQTGAPTQTYTLGAHGHVDAVTAAGQVTHYYADARGRDTLVVDPGGHRQHMHYDNTTGNIDSVLVDGTGAGTLRQFVRLYFDGMGRVTGRLTNGQPLRQTSYDLLNRVVTSNDGVNGNPTSYNYDSAFVVSVTDPSGKVYRRQTNALGWTTTEHRPQDPLSLTTRYNVEGLVTGRTNRRGDIIAYRYDPLHRLVERSGSNIVAATFGYSATGDRVAGSNAVSIDSIFASQDGRVDSTVTRIAGQRFRVQHAVDAYRRPLSTTISSTTPIAFPVVGYEWNDAVGALSAVSVGSSRSTFTYGAAELMRDSTKWPVGVARVERYTSRHQLAAQAYTVSSVDGYFYRGYAYDDIGRISDVSSLTSPTSSLDFERFGYDPLGRLSAFTRGANEVASVCTDDPDRGLMCTTGAPSLHYKTNVGYDPVDNVLSTTDTVFSANAYSTSSTATSTYEPGTNRLSSSNGMNYQYDLDGNRVRMYGAGVDVQYGWSADGLLTSISSFDQYVTYDYNAFGHLVRKSSQNGTRRHFLWDNDNLLAELDASATQRVAEYVHTFGTDQPFALVTGQATPVVRYFVQDGVGNVLGLIAPGGIVNRSVRFDPWGAIISGGGTVGDTSRLGWKGLAWESDAGLYYARNRWYDPSARRFISEDPIGISGGNNPYVFGGADPINHADPFGLKCAVDVDLYFFTLGLFGCDRGFAGINLFEFSRSSHGWGGRGDGLDEGMLLKDPSSPRLVEPGNVLNGPTLSSFSLCDVYACSPESGRFRTGGAVGVFGAGGSINRRLDWNSAKASCSIALGTTLGANVGYQQMWVKTDEPTQEVSVPLGIASVGFIVTSELQLVGNSVDLGLTYKGAKGSANYGTPDYLNGANTSTDVCP